MAVQTYMPTPFISNKVFTSVQEYRRHSVLPAALTDVYCCLPETDS